MASTRITNHSYRSPLLGAYDYHIRHKTQNDTITKTSYGSLSYQREIVTPDVSTAVADTLKLEGNKQLQGSETQDEYSAPRDKVPSTLNYCPNAKGIGFITKTPKELARDYRYISNVFVNPGPKAGAGDYSLNRTGYQPYPEEYLHEKLKHRPNLQESTLWSNTPGFDAKTEFSDKFRKPKIDDSTNQALPTTKYDPKSLYYCCPIGPAKLNITHNIITGIVELTCQHDLAR